VKVCSGLVKGESDLSKMVATFRQSPFSRGENTDSPHHNRAVRFGRVPKREKAKILAAMQQSNIAKSAENALARELEDLDKLTGTIVEAHLETCEFTRAKVERMFDVARRDTGGKMACPLNPQSTPMTDFSSRFSPAIRGVVEFAKRLPGFSLLSQDDQVTLLKAGVFEVLLVRLASMFRNNAMLCINGVLLERCSAQGQNTRFLLDSMFKFAEGFNELGLSDEVVGIFCAVVVMASDRPGLRNTDLIHRLSMNFRSALGALLPPNLAAELERKIPDLRTLNTLHSEKLLAFKMEESFQDPNPEFTYKSFPSPSADSGIESGNCSSPARSEDFGSVCEEMPVLKRALQAPPIVDNNFVCEFSRVNHKKFRRQSPPPPPQTPPPAMLYPQLASALTRPPPPPPSALFSAHSTLAHRLNEKPSNCETSDYIHSLIMAEPSPDYESPLNLSTKHPHSSTIQV
jgi:hypothetical protein